LTVKLTS